MLDRLERRIARKVIGRRLAEMAREGRLEEVRRLADMLAEAGLIDYEYEEIRLGHREAKPIAGNLWAFRWDNDIYFVKVGFWKKLKLKLFGHTYVCHIRRKEWRGPLPIHIVKCKKHGYYACYPMGYQGYFLCPKCFEEERRRV